MVSPGAAIGDSVNVEIPILGAHFRDRDLVVEIIDRMNVAVRDEDGGLETGGLPDDVSNGQARDVGIAHQQRTR